MKKLLHHKKHINIFTTIEENCQFLIRALNETEDLEIEEVTFQQKQGKLVYLHTISDIKKIERIFSRYSKKSAKNKKLFEKTIDVTIHKTKNLQEIIKFLIKGKSVLFIEKAEEAYVLDTPIEMNRTPEEPDTEKTVRGSHLGFIEDLNTNLCLLRKRIKNEQLKIKYLSLGTETNRNVSIVYIDRLANKETVAEVEKRLSSISIDTIFAPGFIEEFIEDRPFSPFPQNLYTERPDRVEAHLMEGRIAVISEGSADAIILPVTFFSFFQSPDDYNNRMYAGTVFRLLRFFSFLGTLLLPPLYIALVGFHFEIIPYEMITIVKHSIAGVPFSPFFEALFMAVTVELIREAGIRLPSPIGETIGIVGGLIIGDAVVNAGLVSNVMVIVIALTAIMSFTISSYEMGNTVRILNLPIMIAASLFGFVGIVFAFSIIIIHMCKLETFGVPYLSPLAPLHIGELVDSIFRFPIWLSRKRPESVRPQDMIKQGESREWYDG